MNRIYKEWRSKIILRSKFHLTVFGSFFILRHLVSTWPVYYYLRKYYFDRMKQVYQILVATYTSKHLYILTHIVDRWGSQFAVERRRNLFVLKEFNGKNLSNFILICFESRVHKDVNYSVLTLANIVNKTSLWYQKRYYECFEHDIFMWGLCVNP